MENSSLLQRGGGRFEIEDRSKKERRFRFKMEKDCFSIATLWYLCQGILLIEGYFVT
jgi:hypothetical protein